MKSLQELTVNVTAFPSWVDFAAALDRGYVPTLQPRESMGDKHNADVQELANRLESLGWSVWRGSNRRAV